MAKIIKTTTLRDHLADALKQINKKEKYLLVTNKGKLVSALINIDFLEELLMASSPEYLKSIKEARRDYEEGRIYSHEDVFGEL